MTFTQKLVYLIPSSRSHVSALDQPTPHPHLLTSLPRVSLQAMMVPYVGLVTTGCRISRVTEDLFAFCSRVHKFCRQFVGWNRYNEPTNVRSDVDRQKFYYFINCWLESCLESSVASSVSTTY